MKLRVVYISLAAMYLADGLDYHSCRWDVYSFMSRGVGVPTQYQEDQNYLLLP
jgi:hypothetical protein